MRILLLLIFVGGCFCQFNFTQIPFPSNRKDMAGATANGKLYFAGGWNITAGTFSDRIDMYDLQLAAIGRYPWIVASLSAPRHWLAGTTAGKYVLFAGGYNGAYSKVVDIIDSGTNELKTQSFDVGRTFLASATVGTMAIFAGGQTDNEAKVKTVDIWDSRTANWVAHSYSLSIARDNLVGTGAKDWAVFAGGISATGPVKTVDIFNLANRTVLVGSLSFARKDIGASSWNNLVVFAGGWSPVNETFFSTVDIYNVDNGVWASTKLDTERAVISVGTILNYFFFVGGVISGSKETNQVNVMNTLTREIRPYTSEGITGWGAPALNANNQGFFAYGSSVQVVTVIPPNPPRMTNNEVIATDPKNESKPNPAAIVVPIVLILIIAIAAAIVVFIVMKRRRNGRTLHKSSDIIQMNLSQEIPFAAYTPLPAKLDFDNNDLVIRERIGQGASGIVHRGQWRGIQVAVKQLSAEWADPKLLEVFRQECDLMKKMKPHPNVLKFFGLIEEPLSIVTEYCENGSLETYLFNKNAFIDMTKRVYILKSIATGMAHCAQQKIVHRDLAARNCLLRADFETVVSDFGMSRTHNQGDQYLATAQHQGWPVKWMAPETFDQLKFNEKTDVFSFGIVCVEVLTRMPPYPEYSVPEFLMHLVGKDLVATLPTYIPDSTPQFLRTLIKQCVSKDPELRPDFYTISKVFDHN